MKEIDCMKAVYTYLSRQIWEIMDKTRLPYEAFLTTIPAKDIQDKLSSQGIDMDITSNSDGTISLDDIHIPVIERIVRAYSELVPGLSGFKYSYPTSGSSEGIREVMKQLQQEGAKEIYILPGEYEGYAFNAGFYGMNSRIVDVSDAADVSPGYWFISNPSARDGNIIENEAILGLCDRGHKIILDLAYVGSTRPNIFDINHENILYVVMSLSKPYGLFRYRIGFAFAKNEIPALYGNRWFKDAERFVQGMRVVEEIGPYRQHELLGPVQKQIVEELNSEHGLELKVSDAFLLAHMTAKDAAGLVNEQQSLIKEYRREDVYRFCITPQLGKKLGGRVVETSGFE